MEFIPRFKHPFTWDQLLEMDVVEIAQEVSRLQDSVQRLKDTQLQLQEYLTESADHDPDVCAAVDENKVVIESQSERIQMLRFALQARGLVRADNPHYDLVTPDVSISAPTTGSGEPAPSSPSNTTQQPGTNNHSSTDEGVYL